ncbi:MAG: tRNA dimethylallyltransferase [Candidatus Yanofskybacteria bacterium]|nr:tRNA dimethylallyltransferase [Candidatus Yanofskybacteria bacterium]
MIGGKAPKIVVIVGPTASGKSDLAIKIARKMKWLALTPMHRCEGEIISADSRQVYRGMDVGTGKVPRDRNPKSKILPRSPKTTGIPAEGLGINPKQTQNSKFKIQNQDYYSEGVRHYLIDVASPKKQFTADDFKRLGQKAIKEILTKNKIPIIVGGTGFYIDVLLGRMSVAEVPPNKKLRKGLGNLEIEKLFEKLKKLDPERAKTIDPKNKRRLIRAVEIAMARKSIKKALKNKSDLYYDRGINQMVGNYDVLWLGLNPGKEKLAVKIKKRLDERLKQGMIKEVKNLHKPGSRCSGCDFVARETPEHSLPGKQGVSWKRLDELGLEYRWISGWLRKYRKQRTPKSFSNSQEYQNLLRDIIKYSKRQMTWFKRNKEIHWLAPSEVEGIKNQKEAGEIIRKFLASRP